MVKITWPNNVIEAEDIMVLAKRAFDWTVNVESSVNIGTQIQMVICSKFDSDFGFVY